MFFSDRPPKSSNVASNRPATASRTFPEIKYSARWRFPFQPSCYVDAIPIQVVAVHDQVAQVQAHAEHQRRVCRLVMVRVRHGLLEFDGGAQGIDGAGELDERAVAGQLDQSTSVFLQDWIEMLRAALPKARQRPALVTPHQA